MRYTLCWRSALEKCDHQCLQSIAIYTFRLLPVCIHSLACSICDTVGNVFEFAITVVCRWPHVHLLCMEHICLLVGMSKYVLNEMDSLLTSRIRTMRSSVSTKVSHSTHIDSFRSAFVCLHAQCLRQLYLQFPLFQLPLGSGLLCTCCAFVSRKHVCLLIGMSKYVLNEMDSLLTSRTRKMRSSVSTKYRTQHIWTPSGLHLSVRLL